MSDERMKSYLKERLGGYEHPVDDALWPSLNRNILRKKNTLRRTLIAACVCTGAAAIALGLLMVTLVPTGAEDAVDTPLAEDYRPEANPVVQEGELQTSDFREITKPDTPGQTPKPVVGRTAGTAESIHPESVEDKPADMDVRPEGEETDETAGHDEVRPVHKFTEERYPPLPPERRSRRNKNLSVLLAVNGSGFAGNGDDRPDMSSGGNSVTPEGDFIDLYDPVYDFPVSFSLAVRRELSGRFAVETGLAYSYLRTKDSKNVTDIKLHYLGIPLKGIYTFYDNRRISLYTSAGGMVERQVAGKLKHPPGNRNLIYSGLQWSVNASAGVNLKLGNHVGLFAEPGVVYFFDDGSNIPTIRKEKPFNFNLQIGLRFNINK